MPPLKKIYTDADELKVIISKPDDFEWAEKNCELVKGSCHLFLQPEWSSFESIMPEIVSYVKKNTKWRISVQAHKYMHIP